MSASGWAPIGGGIYHYRGHLVSGERGAWWLQRAVRVGPRIVTGPVAGPYPTQAAARAEIDRAAQEGA